MKNFQYLKSKLFQCSNSLKLVIFDIWNLRFGMYNFRLFDKIWNFQLMTHAFHKQRAPSYFNRETVYFETLNYLCLPYFYNSMGPINCGWTSTSISTLSANIIAANGETRVPYCWVDLLNLPDMSTNTIHMIPTRLFIMSLCHVQLISSRLRALRTFQF